ncbi:MAG: DinB family protein [Sphingobacteriaceae bacterium]|nr:DinB family protein [Sphingobacteriaceae bacterium]
METLVIDSRMHSLIILYDMHTKFFFSALEGISDEDANNRLNTKANHIAWLTGSLVQQRFELAQAFSIDKKQAANDLFSDNKGIQDEIIYPSLSKFKVDWENITPPLRNALHDSSTEKLNSTFEMMPGMSMTYFDLITFIIYREANCIGQIALWRRLLGYEGMKYM